MLKILSFARSPLWVCAICVAFAGCDGGDSGGTAGHSHDEQPGHSHDDGHAHSHEEAGHEGHEHAEGEHAEDDHGETTSADVVAIPAQVRQNLGITFATVTPRRVASTMRVPGRFEPLPSAVREYHAPLPGRVELLVHQYDHVTTGTALYRLDSSEWRRMQQELLKADAEVMATSASLMTAMIARAGGDVAKAITQQRIESAEAHIRALQESIQVAENRVAQVERLQEVTGGQMAELNEAQAQVASLKTELTEAREEMAALSQQQIQLSTEGGGGAFGTTESLKAAALARRSEYESTVARKELLRASLQSITGGFAPGGTTATADWTIKPDITVRALAEGVVTEIPVTSGAYVDRAAEIMTTVDTSRLRFRAVALQSDVELLDSKMSGRILRPGTAIDGGGEFIPVTVRQAFEADPEERTLDLVAEVPASEPWARPGLSTDLELVLDETAQPQLAIPTAAVIQDGLEKIFFRRNPEIPDQAVRIEADLGISNGDWVVLESGVKAGDQVVLNGVYELKLATSDSPSEVGHVHADGTFHEGDH